MLESLIRILSIAFRVRLDDSHDLIASAEDEKYQLEARTALETARAIKEQGGVVYVPHPFDPMRRNMAEPALYDLARAGNHGSKRGGGEQHGHGAGSREARDMGGRDRGDPGTQGRREAAGGGHHTAEVGQFLAGQAGAPAEDEMRVAAVRPVAPGPGTELVWMGWTVVVQRP